MSQNRLDDWGMPSDRPKANGVTIHGSNNAARNHYNSLIYFAEDYQGQIDKRTVHDLARWGSKMWSKPKPGNPPWDKWFMN